MLANSDTNIEDVASIILGHNYDVAFLVPTETGLKKSILDAHQSIKALFKREHFHDYENQQQGDIHKITAHYITKDETFDKTVSRGAGFKCSTTKSKKFRVRNKEYNWTIIH